MEIELPLLDSERRMFLMFRRNESLIELMPSPEDDFFSEPDDKNMIGSYSIVYLTVFYYFDDKNPWE